MKARRLPLLALAVVALATGMATGLRRVGWDLSGPGAAVPFDHGPLMIAGFLGTLIGLERAVALGRTWVYAGPLLSGVGALSHVAGAPPMLESTLTAAASTVLLMALATVLRDRPSLFVATMTMAAACWLIGALLRVIDAASVDYVAWWTAFLVLTIAAERLELMRVLPATRGGTEAFVAITGCLLMAVASGGLAHPRPARALGLALVLLAAWLVRYDVARRTIRQHGLVRFTATCLLSGYAWLAVAGLLLMRSGAVIAGPIYDAVLHAIFLGFVFAMILGHAPIVFPAVLGVPIPFARAFYGPLVLLHLSLAARVAGDVGGSLALRQWATLTNAVTVAFFFTNTIAAIARGAVDRTHEEPLHAHR